MLRERAASAWVGNGAEGMGTCALERQWQKREIQMVRDYNIQYTGFYGAHNSMGVLTFVGDAIFSAPGLRAAMRHRALPGAYTAYGGQHIF